MDRLALRGDLAEMTGIVNVICQRDLRVKELALREIYRGGGAGRDCSAFTKGLCELVKFSPDVEVLDVMGEVIRISVEPLGAAIADTRLRGLHLDCGMSGIFTEQAKQTLISGLRLNSSLRMFTVTGATEAQKEEIRRLVEANGMPAATRLAIGHGFAGAVGDPYRCPSTRAPSW